MPATIEYEPNNICVLRVSGILKRSEFGQVQSTTARDIDAGVQPRILAIAGDFKGWERSPDWDDFGFVLSHGDEIAKIAIVAEPRWEAEMLAFAGAGFRRTPVKFFPASQLAEARAWLAE